MGSIVDSANKILKAPILTEKATGVGTLGRGFVLEVSPKANKFEIKKAVEEVNVQLKNIPVTFVLFSLLMVLFFVKDMEMAFGYYQRIFSFSFFEFPNFPFRREILLLILFMIFIEWSQRDQEFATKYLFSEKSIFLRWAFYYVLVFLIFLFYIAPKGFIYAQF